MLPWQMKSTLCIFFVLLKVPRNAVVWGISWIIVKVAICLSIRQIIAHYGTLLPAFSSQNGSKMGGDYYSFSPFHPFNKYLSV